MQITDADIEKFREACREADGSEISADQAREALFGLLFLFERFHGWMENEHRAGRLLDTSTSTEENF